MRRLASKLFSLPWHPLIFSIYPILILYANNIKQAEQFVMFRPLAISVALACALLILLRVLFSDWRRVAFFATILILLFFSYGHVYNYIKSAALFGIVLGRHRLLLLIWAGLAVMALLIAFRRSLNIENYTITLNSIALILLLFPAFASTPYWLSTRDIPKPYIESAKELTIKKNQSLPDVYYIILDSYTRSDVLKEVYDYDNSSFLNELNEMDFYVAECSTSNYMWTRASIASALNMGYLQDNLSYRVATDKDIATEDLIKHSLVRQIFESLGYKTVAFATGFPFNEITDADLFLEPPSSIEGVREFEALLVQTTLLRVFQDFGYIHINQKASAKFRDRTLFALSKFDDLARLGGPKFVYIHIITPHPPFVFGPHGESINPKDFVSTEEQYTDDTYFDGYVGQVEFINDQIIKSIQKLLDKSQVPSVIILQGDHGPWKQQGENRVSILNAYYLPEHHDALYSSISPVNSFRVIFNEYFDARYPLLEDISYKSLYANIYDFQLQPTSCDNGR